VNEEMIHRESATVHRSMPRNHLQSPCAVGVADAEPLDLGLRHPLVRLDIKVPLDIHPHSEVCKPSADTAIPVEQHVCPFAEFHHLVHMPRPSPQWAKDIEKASNSLKDTAPKVRALKPHGPGAPVQMPSPDCRLGR